MNSQLIYSDKYDFDFKLLNKLHPFDGLKFSKAWKLISTEFKTEIDSLWVASENEISDDALLKVHTSQYLASLDKSSVISSVIEIGMAKFIPSSVLKSVLLNPVKLACKGTLIAAEQALMNKSIAMNIGGGFHHAFSDHGEGFCFYADAALSIINCREKGLLKADDTVLMIDLDAHRGNGFESVTKADKTVKNFDMYGFQSYPGLHDGEPDEYPYMIPLKSGVNDLTYLSILETELEKFLNENDSVKLVFYNAGNDILESDPLGGLKVSYEGVVKRDEFVIQQLRKRNIPTAVMTSGGYTSDSHKLIAQLAKIIVESGRG